MLLYRWPTPLRRGTLVRRYERFVAEVRLGREVVRAHCVNPGRMEGFVVPGATVWLSEAPGRALPWTWELLELDGRLLGANTALPNRLVREALERRLLAGLDDALQVKPEQPFGRGHRVDFVVERPQGPHYVEVKNCHLVYPDACAYFPDSVSARATAHVEALARLVKQGVPASVVFTVQRDDAQRLRPSALHDPAFATALRRAVKAGLTARALRLVPSLEGITLAGELPVDVAPYDAQATARWASALEETSGWQRKDGGWAGRTLTPTRRKKQ